MNKAFLVFAILTLSFIKKNRLIKWLTSIFNKRLISYHFKVSIGHSHFQKLNQIEICNVDVQSKRFSFAAESISVDFDLRKIFSRSRVCSSIAIDNGDIIFYPHGEGNQNVKSPHISRNIGLLRRIIGLLQKKWTRLLCEDVEISKLRINSSRYGTAEIKKFSLSGGIVRTSLVADNHLFNGNIDFELGFAYNRKYFTISNYTISCSGISLISNTFSAEKMNIILNVKPETDKLKFAVNVSCQNLLVQNKSIYPNAMQHESIGLALDIDIVDQNIIIFNESSKLYLSDLIFAIELKLDLDSGVTFLQVLSHNIVFENMLKQLSAPSYLARLDTDGSFDFRLACKYVPSNWKNSNVDAKLQLHNFKIINFGDLKLDSLLYPFIHTVYNSDPTRLIELSDSNALFLQIDNIPKILIDLLIRHEDPEFFSHKGVSPSYMGYALITNLNDKKITRGGSTITMQVIRNLYLGHSQNLQRKIEEIILALILENFSGISKQRLLEIYLNIIEFGPDIYGLASACKFYFGKQVSEITALDSIILIYIIPRPKYFLPALLKKTPQLKRNLRNHIDNYNLFIQEKGFRLEGWEVNKPFMIQFSKEIGSLLL